jgi:predicted phosphodiesterase
MASKWSSYKDEILGIIKEEPNTSPKEIAQRIAECHQIEYEDTFRMYVSRIRKREGYPPFSPGREKKFPASKGKTTYEENSGKGEANWEYKGEQVITTLKDALKFCQVDLSKWEVDRHIFNSWDTVARDTNGSLVKRTNYQVKVWFKKRTEADEKVLRDFRNEVATALSSRSFKRKVNKSAGRTSSEKKHVGFIPIADLHIGAYIRDLIITQNFDVETVVAMLDEVASEINSQNYSEVHIAILGDVIESFTGKNHLNSFQSIGYGQTGFSIFITAYEILENFIASIDNVKKVYCVSGNHDRYSSSNKEDVKGEVMQGLAYFLDKHLNVDVEYNPLVITAVIDGICYVITHGHHGFSKKNLEKIILDYGKQGMFNVVVMGHYHSRTKKEILVKVETIIKDSSKYRGYICPSLFTGNFFSEALGFSSVAGFLQFWNKNGNPVCLDIPL